MYRCYNFKRIFSLLSRASVTPLIFELNFMPLAFCRSSRTAIYAKYTGTNWSLCRINYNRGRSSPDRLAVLSQERMVASALIRRFGRSNPNRWLILRASLSNVRLAFLSVKSRLASRSVLLLFASSFVQHFPDDGDVVCRSSFLACLLPNSTFTSMPAVAFDEII